jgi:hypothetical protein
MLRDKLDRSRIASLELLPNVEVLPHLKCSRAMVAWEQADEENEHGDAGGAGSGGG